MAKHKTYSPLDDQCVTLSMSKAFNDFRARRDEIRLSFLLSVVCRLDQGRKPDERFLQKHIFETIFHQIWTKA